jgi:hypothetical protein
VLDVRTGPDTTAPAGRGGSWLIDPFNLAVVAAQTVLNCACAPFFTPLGDNSEIGADLINAQLNLGSNVTLTTTGIGANLGTQPGNLTIAAPITKSVLTPAFTPTLTVLAHNNVVVNAGATISSTVGAMNVTLQADQDLNGTGGVTLNAAVLTNGGSATFRGSGAAGVAINAPVDTRITTGATPTGGNSITINNAGIGVNHTGAVTIGETLNSGTSSTTIRSATSIAVNSSIAPTSFGSVTLAADGSASIAVNAAQSMQGGSFNTQSVGTGGVTIAAPITNTSGSVSIQTGGASSGNTTVGAPITTTSGSITVSSTGSAAAVAVNGVLTSTNGSINVFNGGSADVTIAQSVSSTNSSVSLSANGTGNLIVSAPVSAGFTASLTAGTNGTLTTTAAVSGSAVNLKGDLFSLGGSTTAGGGGIFIRSTSFGRPIDLGTKTPGTLGLTTVELGSLSSTGTITIGESAAGALTVSAPLTFASMVPVTLRTGSAMAINAPLTTNGTLTLTSTGITVGAPVTVSGGGDLIVEPFSGLGIGVVAMKTGGLQLTPSEIDLLNTSGTLQLGSTNFATNGVTIDAAIAPAGASTLFLSASNGSVSQSAGATISVSNLRAEAGGFVFLNEANGVSTVAGSASIFELTHFPAGTVTVGTVAGASGISASVAKIKSDNVNINNTVFANTFTVTPATPGRPIDLIGAGAKSGGSLELTQGDVGNVFATDFQLRADAMNVTGPMSFNGMRLTLAPVTVGTDINVNSGTKAGGLAFLDTELALISAAGGVGLVLGDTVSTNNVNINTAITRSGYLGLFASPSPGPVPGHTVTIGAPLNVDQLELKADKVDIPGSITAPVEVRISASTPARTIAVLDSKTGGALELTGAELAGITTFLIALGDGSTTGAINITGPTLPALSAQNFAVQTTGTVTNSTSVGVTGNLDITAGTITSSNVVATLNGYLALNAGTITLNDGIQSVNDSIFITADNFTWGGMGTVTAGQAVTVDRRNFGNIAISTTPVGGSLTLTPAFISSVTTGGSNFLRIGQRFGNTSFLTVSNPFSYGGKLALESSNGITSTASISTTGPLVLRTFGSATLNSSNNITGAFAADIGGTLLLNNGGAFNNLVVGNVDGMNGISAGNTVTLLSENMDIQSPIFATNVELKPATNAVMVDIGGADNGSTLGISQAELNNVTAFGSLLLGDLNANSLTVSSPITVNTGTLLLRSSNAITVAGDLSNTGGSIDINAFRLINSAPIAANALGTVTIRVNESTITAGISGGTVSIAPRDLNTPIDLGGSDLAGPITLGLTNAELANVMATNLDIGDPTNTSTITVTNPVAVTPNLTLQTNAGGAVSVNSTLTAAGALQIQTNDVTLGAQIMGGQVKIAPLTSGRTMDFGADPGGTLGLSTAELGFINTAGAFRLGDANSTGILNVTACPGTPCLAASSLSLTGGTINHNTALSMPGDITYTANTLAFTQPLASTGGGRITMQRRTNGAITIGGAGSFLPSAAIDSISTSGVLQIGNTSSTSSLQVTGPIAPAGVSTLALLSQGNISQTAGSTITESNLNVRGNNVTLTEANSIGTLAGGNTCCGTFNVKTAGTMTIGTVDGQNGLTNVSSLLLTADNMVFSQPVSGFSQVTLAPATAGRSIDIGGADGAALGIDAADLSMLPSFTSLKFGSATTGDIAVNTPLARNGGFLDFQTGAGRGVSINAPVSTTSGITIVTDALAVGAALETTSTSVNINTVGALRPVDLGTETAGALSLTQPEFDLITTGQFGTLTIGVNNDLTGTGLITISAPIKTSANVSRLTLNTGSGVAETGTGALDLVKTFGATTEGRLTINSNDTAGGSVLLAGANNVTHLTATLTGANRQLVFNNTDTLKLQNVTISNNGTGSTTLVTAKCVITPVVAPPAGNERPPSELEREVNRLSREADKGTDFSNSRKKSDDQEEQKKDEKKKQACG